MARDLPVRFTHTRTHSTEPEPEPGLPVKFLRRLQRTRGGHKPEKWLESGASRLTAAPPLAPRGVNSMIGVKCWRLVRSWSWFSLLEIHEQLSLYSPSPCHS
ncbi:hypothetical protein XENORESO_017337, partial [Xenotaenia resolanae]